jgi:hypothetical protein
MYEFNTLDGVGSEKYFRLRSTWDLKTTRNLIEPTNVMPNAQVTEIL